MTGPARARRERTLVVIGVALVLVIALPLLVGVFVGNEALHSTPFVTIAIVAGIGCVIFYRLRHPWDRN